MSVSKTRTAYRVVVRIQCLHECFRVALVHELVTHAGAVTHDHQDARTEDLEAVVRARAYAHAWRALLARADDALVHGDVVVEDGEDVAGVAGSDDLEGRAVDLCGS